jgi:DNA polymerase-3 subunit beta
MKLKVAQNILYDALKKASRAVPSKAHLPQLEHIALNVENSALEVQATDLSTSICDVVTDVTISGGGAITVPASTLTDLVRAMEGTITLEADHEKKTLRVEAGRSEANIKGMDYEEFPAMPSRAVTREPIEGLAAALGQVIPAAAKDVGRPILTGVLMEAEGGRLTLAAADGFRLAVRRIEHRGEFSVIVPAGSLKSLVRIAGDEPVRMRATDNKVVFQVGQTVLSSQLIDGNYPDYGAIIPDSISTVLVLDKAEFERALATVAVVARNAANIVRLSDSLSLSSTATEIGESDVGVKADLDGEPVEVTFNVDYLQDALSAIHTERVRLGLNGSSSPGLLEPVGGTDYRHVIMPMQLGE